MRTEKFIHATGKKRDEIDLNSYRFAVATIGDEENIVYDSEEHRQHYRIEGYERRPKSGKEEADDEGSYALTPGNLGDHEYALSP